MEGNKFATCRLKIGSVLKESNFDKYLKKRLQKFVYIIEEEIRIYLRKCAKEVLDIVENSLKEQGGSGRHYMYMDDDGTLLHEWDSSGSGEPPVYVSGTLYGAVETKLDFYNFNFEIGVWSNKKGGLYPTYAYTTVDDNTGILHVNESKGKQTPVSEYAKYLEEGTDKMHPRPFLEPAMEYFYNERRFELTKEMRSNIESKFGRKLKGKMHFRMYFKKRNSG